MTIKADDCMYTLFFFKFGFGDRQGILNGRISSEHKIFMLRHFAWYNAQIIVYKLVAVSIYSHAELPLRIISLVVTSDCCLLQHQIFTLDSHKRNASIAYT